MSFALLPEVSALLAETEHVLGRHIETIEDRALGVAATTAVVPARPNYGKIRISPVYCDCADYFVANQCGHLLRYGRAPPEYRLVPTERPDAYAKIEHLLSSFVHNNPELYPGIPAEALRKLARLALTGLVAQVTNVPVDCRIDRWLYRAVPTIRNRQEEALARLLSNYSQTLSDESRAGLPALLYGPSTSMNAAFSRNASGLFPDLAKEAERYRAFINEHTVDALLKALDLPDEGHASDIRVADAWASQLAIRDLYEWRAQADLSSRL